MSDQTYNGWTNHPTWLINLHITNDQNLAAEFEDTVRNASSEYEASKEVRAMIESWVETYIEADYRNPVLCMIGDMIGSFLSEVNWQEIIDAIWPELHEEPEEEEPPADYEPDPADELG